MGAVCGARASSLHKFGETGSRLRGQFASRQGIKARTDLTQGMCWFRGVSSLAGERAGQQGGRSRLTLSMISMGKKKIGFRGPTEVDFEVGFANTTRITILMQNVGN